MIDRTFNVNFLTNTDVHKCTQHSLQQTIYSFIGGTGTHLDLQEAVEYRLTRDPYLIQISAVYQLEGIIG